MYPFPRSPLPPKLFAFFFFLAAFYLPIEGSAQPLLPHIENFGDKKDFAGYNQILALDRDEWGGIWVSSGVGVHHFNGVEWESFLIKEGIQVYALHVDEQQRVWAGGKGELGYLSPHENKSREKDKRFDEGLDFVSLLDELPEGASGFNIIWGIEQVGERIFFNGREVLFVYEEDSLYSVPPRGEKFFRIHEGEDGLWIQDLGKGIYRLPEDEELQNEKGKLLKEHRIPKSKASPEVLWMALLPRSHAFAPPDGFLLSSFRNGLFHYLKAKDTGKAGISKFPFEGEEDLNSSGFYDASGPPALSSDRQDKRKPQYPLSVGTTRKGVILFDSSASPVHLLRGRQDIPADNIWGIIKGGPGTGTIWAGTDKGLSRIRTEDPRSFALHDIYIRKIIRHQGDIWVASNAGVLARRDPERGALTGTRWDSISDGRHKFYDLLSLQNRDGADGVLGAAGSGGLHLLKGENEKDELLLDIDAFRIASLSDRHIVVAGRHGIFFLEHREGTGWDVLLHIEELPEALRVLKVRQRSPEKGVELFGGMNSKGLLHFEIPLERISKEIGDSLSLSWKTVLREDPLGVRASHYLKDSEVDQPEPLFYQDRILLGSSNGLWKMVPKKGKEGSKEGGMKYGILPEKRFGERHAGVEDEGELKTSVSSLELGAKGTFWGLLFKGAYRFHPAPEEGYRTDSVPFKNFEVGHINTVLADSNGVTWFGGKEGLLRYDPRVERSFDRNYTASIRKVRVELSEKTQERKGEKDSLIGSGHYKIPDPEAPALSWTRSIHQPEEEAPSLPYRLNGLSFEFSAYHYEKRKGTRYSYKLEGHEEQWSPWQKEREKSYTNLWEGEYCFKVKARNVYGKESEVAEFHFRIEPPWYRTYTAYAGYGVFAVLLLVGVGKASAYRSELKRKRLEKIVNERTREIQEKNQALEEEKERVEKAHEELSEAHEELSEAHQEITQSIDYAQKIQQALLQSEEHVSPHLPDHFILFKPQAKVSGDFYWGREHKGYLYVAAMDCTGHGVPGAFMSMLGISQLDEIMASDELLTPGEILTELRERVVRELSGSEPDETAKDGMDAALLRIPLDEQESKTIAFAGAQNPLYVIRKGIANEDLSGPPDLTGLGVNDRLKPFKKSPDGIEIKGDPMPVGYDEYASGDFTTVSLQLQKGDTLYIFSDGYADQFGGPKGKKFRYGPFKELLVGLHEKSVEEQKAELDRTFEEWKAEGEQEQIDDVVVVGLRL